MANYNKVILIGNLTRDPQLTYLPSNTPVADFGLAVNRRWRGSDGQTKDETCFIDCKAFGKTGETVNQYLSKGRALLVEGRLQFQQWTAQDGTRRSKHVVIVEQFQFLDSRRDGEASATRPSVGIPEQSASGEPDSDITKREVETPVLAEDDIPF